MANLTRGVNHSFRTQYWTGTLGDTVSAGDFTLSAGLRFDLQRARNLPARSFANVMFEDPCPTLRKGRLSPGLPEVPVAGSQLADSIRRLAAPGLGHVRARTDQGHAAAGDLRALRWTSSAGSRVS